MKLYRNICIVGILMFFGIQAKVKSAIIRRHVIVAVDCSGSFQNSTQRMQLYSQLKQLLLSDNSETLGVVSPVLGKEVEAGQPFFVSSADHLSLYMFGMPGYRWDDIYKRSGAGFWVDDNSFPSYFCNQFIFHLDDWTAGSVIPLSSFVDNNVKSLFGQAASIKAFREGGRRGITLSHYVYPLLLRQGLQNGYASEYVMLLLTDYKSGTSEGDGGDRNRICELAHVERNSNGHKMQAFDHWIDELSQGLYRVDYFKTVCGELTMKAFKVRPKTGVTTEDTQLIVESDLRLQQTAWNSDEYTLASPVLLRFQHNDAFRVDSLLLQVCDDSGQTVCAIPLESTTDEEGCLSIEKLRLPLDGITSGDDFNQLQFRFRILGTYSYKGINLPICYEATRILQPSSIEFKNPFILTIIKMIIALIALLCFLAVLYIMAKRGKRKKVAPLKLVYSDDMTGHFQQVSKTGAVLLPCNFVNGRSTITYQLQGRITNEVGFCFPWIVNHVFVKATLANGSPDGMAVKMDGSEEGGWTHVVMNRDGKTFNAIATLIIDTDEIHTPNQHRLDKGEELEVTLEVQTKFEPCFPFLGNNPFSQSGIPGVTNETSFTESYKDAPAAYNRFLERAHFTYAYSESAVHNFIKRPFDSENFWVGIDPGTNGSCITIGNTQDSTAQKVNMVRVTAKDDDGSYKNVIDSVIVLGGSLQKPDNYDTTKWENGTHFDFGLHASHRIDLYNNNGAYIYRSIKKLLGYKKGGQDGRIKASIGGTNFLLTGMDLQYLLVKALTKGVMSDYLVRIMKEPALANIKNSLFSGNKEVSMNKFQRAVVAIPNNYQLPQILDMVESVKRNGFREVKFIYEPEGVLFHYLQKTWANHATSNAENIIVFDMGGATINATIFHVDYVKVDDQIHYHVSTLSRLGYAVGGDDIDYAILEFLMHFDRIVRNFNDDAARYRFQDEHKTALLELAKDFKLKFITMSNNLPKGGGNSRNMPVELSTLDNFIANYLAPIMEMIDRTMSFNSSHLTDRERQMYEDNFSEQLVRHLLASTWMQEYVYNKVEDAVLDMMDTDDVRSATNLDQIIFSGRSCFFPAIKETVISTMKERQRSPKEYHLNGDLKSIVADGACWYGIFGEKLVFVDNTRITSSYGFRYSIPGNRSDYVELIKQNTRYEGKYSDTLTHSVDIVSHFESNANIVNFYQVMGSLHHGNSIFDEDNRHKVRYLTAINLGAGQASRETITVKLNGTVFCDVNYQGKPIGQKPFTAEFDTRDITKENARPYLFSVSDNERHQTNVTTSRPPKDAKPKQSRNSKETNFFNNENRANYRRF